MSTNDFTIVPLSRVSMLPLVLLYILAIVIVSIVILLLLRKYPSLRNIRKKRNILIYCILALIPGLLIFQLDTVARRADVGFGIDSIPDKAFRGKISQITLYCNNRGSRSAEFYVVLTSLNASITVRDQQDYLLVSSTTVKVPFSLSENWISGNSDRKNVFFTVDSNVTSFSFWVDIENRAFGELDTPGGVWSVRFVWNATENCYIMTERSQIAAA
jgi:hypothetical protein